jgi:aspartate/methionine/tyrosine aminotransferase
VFGDFNKTCHGGLDYYDRTLLHYTPQHPTGTEYSPEMLDYWHEQYVALKIRMFHDVVYGQFGHLNGPPPDAGTPLRE